MKIIYLKIFYNKINPDENFPDYGILYVTVRAKTSLVHTSKFATSVLYNFGWERSTELKFAMLVH